MREFLTMIVVDNWLAIIFVTFLIGGFIGVCFGG